VTPIINAENGGNSLSASEGPLGFALQLNMWPLYLFIMTKMISLVVQTTIKHKQNEQSQRGVGEND